MIVIYQITLGLLTMVEIYLCYAVCDWLVYNNVSLKSHKFYYGSWIVMIALSLSINRNVVFFSSLVFIFMIMLIWLSLILKQREKFTEVIIVIVAYSIFMALLDFVLVFFSYEILQNKFWDSLFWGSNLLKVIIVISARVCFFSMIYYLYKVIEVSGMKIKQIKVTLVILDITGLLGVFWFQVQMVKEGATQGFYNGMLLLILLLIVSYVMKLYVKAEMIKLQADVALFKNELLEKNYHEMSMIYQNSQYVYHDFKNHLVILKEYLLQKDTGKALDYLDKIGAPVQMLYQYVWSNNHVVNLVLNYKVMTASEKGIKVTTDIERVEWGGIEEYDINIIFSNLLDNAIEACELIQSGEKWIHITIKRRKEITFIQIENSKVSSSDKNQKDYLFKKKKGLHGIGKHTVKNAVEKYEGCVNWYSEGNCFSVTVTFFNGVRVRKKGGN